MAGIYIHIPFCSQACHYCDFHFSTSLAMSSQMVEAICGEMTMQKGYLGVEPVDTVYLGGGTPSVLSASNLKRIFEVLRREFDLSSAGEITLEANPDDLSEEKLEVFSECGVNRLSIGIQSFFEDHLRWMNRSHSSEQALQCVDLARQSGIHDVSIDLIYGIPYHDHSVWEKDLQLAIAFDVPHVSAYCLTIEDRTVFGQWQKSGRLPPIEEQFAAEQYEMLIAHLSKAGYEHYEISNFAKPGRYSRHNTSYWQQKSYLGLGPSAHSYNGSSRQHNLANNAGYIRSIKNGEVPFTLEELSSADGYNEYLLTTLRTMWGTNVRLAREKFGFDVLREKQKEVAVLQKEELLFVTDDTLYLTKKGKLLADEITSRLMQ